MKKILAVVTAAALLTSLAGCSRAPGNIKPQASHEAKGATMEVSIHDSYRSERILEEEDRNYTNLLAASKGILASDTFRSEVDANDVVTYTYRTGMWDTEKGELVNTVFSEYQAIASYVTDEGMEVLWMAFDTGTKWGNYRYKLTTHDQDFNELTSQDITDWIAEPSRFIDWTKDNSGNHYIVTGTGAVELYSPEGEFLGDFKGALGMAWDVFRSPDGTIFAANDQHTSFVTLDPETMGMEKLDIKELVGCKDFCDGAGEYDFYTYDSVSVCGVKASAGRMEELVNWDSSGFSSGDTSSHVHSFEHCPDDSFILYEQDVVTGNGNFFWRLTRRPDEETNSMKLISIAAMSREDNLTRMVNWYNRQSEDCQIIWKDYAEIMENEGYEKAMDTLTHDLIGGTVPDILVLENLNYEMFANKGLFEDLRPWMESDPNFQAGDYYTNFFDAMEYKGELHRMAFWYCLYGIYAKTERLNGKTSLTLQDYIDINETLPEGSRLFNWNTQDDLLRALCLDTLGSYVDYAKQECSFNTPEFISLLKLCASAPAGAGVVGEDDLAVDLAMFREAGINAGYSLHMCASEDFQGADITLLAPPKMEGAAKGALVQPIFGTITMSGESFYKEEIWDFMKFCLAHNDVSDGGGLPVSKAAMQSHIAHLLHPAEGDLKCGLFMTQEEADDLLAAVEKADTCIYWNFKIQSIITEEAGMCFAGDCTPEQAAESIQTRVMLYLAEQN